MLPTYTVKLIMEDETVIQRISQAEDIGTAIQTALSIWCRPGDRVIEIQAYEETEV